MGLFRRSAALLRASSFLSHRFRPAICEELESRKLLDANDPVIVFGGAVSLKAFDNFTSATLTPHLWNNPSGEVPWNLDDSASQPWTDSTHDHDYDGNGHSDDVYGWNFIDDSPDIIALPTIQDPQNGFHEADVTLAALNGIIGVAAADASLGTNLASHIKIMFAIGDMSVSNGVPSPALQYVIDKKNAFLNGQPGGANIIAAAQCFLLPKTRDSHLFLDSGAFCPHDRPPCPESLASLSPASLIT
jgi:hypothetical protein